MNFSQLQERLRIELQRRIARDKMNVSLLARMTGLGQGFISNYLHGKRELSPRSMDKVLAALKLEAEDLLPAPMESERERETDVVRVPLVSHGTAMWEAKLESAMVEARMPFPAEVLRDVRAGGDRSQEAWERFVAIRVSEADVAGMRPLLWAGALVVLDRHFNSLKVYPGDGVTAARAGGAANTNVYAVRWGGRLWLRRIEVKDKTLILRPYEREATVQLVRVEGGPEARKLVVGRVVVELSRR